MKNQTPKQLAKKSAMSKSAASKSATTKSEKRKAATKPAASANECNSFDSPEFVGVRRKFGVAGPPAVSRGIYLGVGPSLQWLAFPVLSGFLRFGGRGVGLVEDVCMHAILPDLPNHQNPRPVLASA